MKWNLFSSRNDLQCYFEGFTCGLVAHYLLLVIAMYNSTVVVQNSLQLLMSTGVVQKALKAFVLTNLLRTQVPLRQLYPSHAANPIGVQHENYQGKVLRERWWLGRRVFYQEVIPSLDVQWAVFT